jgi:hypothetical protein
VVRIKPTDLADCFSRYRAPSSEDSAQEKECVIIFGVYSPP